MVTETLYGMLTAAGGTVPFILLSLSGFLSPPSTLTTLIYLLVFAAIPPAVAQTEVSTANGSRYFVSETWPASLAGLGAMAMVLTVRHLMWPNPVGDEGLAFLLIGAIGFVPITEMIVINLTKQPRHAVAPGPVGLITFREDHVFVSAPPVMPFVGSSRLGPVTGVYLPALAGTF